MVGRLFFPFELVLSLLLCFVFLCPRVFFCACACVCVFSCTFSVCVFHFFAWLPPRLFAADSPVASQRNADFNFNHAVSSASRALKNVPEAVDLSQDATD